MGQIANLQPIGNRPRRLLQALVAQASACEGSSLLGVMMLSALALILAIGLFQIFRIRLVSGEFYPEWSSLRSDRGGTRVLFDSLAGTGRVETVRKYKGLAQEPERNATVLFAGFSPVALAGASSDDLDEFEKAAQAGNRIVIAIDPGNWLSPPKQDPTSALAKRWGIAFERLPGNEDTNEAYFTRSAGWTKDAAVNGRLIIVERGFGAGSIVLAAGSGMFSNEALATNRNTSLLLRLLGPNIRVVFDESHLGVQETGSILGLVHKYRLDGALWGLLALAFVFVWSHAAGFPPARAVLTGTIAGHDARGGLAQLLRRQIPASRVVESCVVEWERSNAGQKLLRTGEYSDPAKAYRAIQQELTHK